jgi:hypothetical protein
MKVTRTLLIAAVALVGGFLAAAAITAAFFDSRNMLTARGARVVVVVVLAAWVCVEVVVNWRLVKWSLPEGRVVSLVRLGPKTRFGIGGFLAFYILPLTARTSGDLTVGRLSILLDRDSAYDDVLIPISNHNRLARRLGRVSLAYYDLAKYSCSRGPEQFVDYVLDDSARLVVTRLGHLVGTVEGPKGQMLSPVREVTIRVSGRYDDNCEEFSSSLSFELNDLVPGEGGIELRIGVPRQIRAVEADSSRSLRLRRAGQDLPPFSPGWEDRWDQEWKRLAQPDPYNDTVVIFRHTRRGHPSARTLLKVVVEDERGIASSRVEAVWINRLLPGEWTPVKDPLTVPSLMDPETYDSDMLLDLLLGAEKRVDSPDSSGRTLLHVAAEFAAASVVRRVVADGGTLEAKDSLGWTPLHRAAYRRRAETVRTLLALGSMPDAVDFRGRTALHLAVLQPFTSPGDLAVISALLNAGASPNAPDSAGRTPLHVTAAQAYSPLQIGAMSALVANGGDLGVRTHQGDTPLLLAAATRNMIVAGFLCAAGADAIAEGRNGQEVLEVLAQSIKGAYFATDSARASASYSAQWELWLACLRGSRRE